MSTFTERLKLLMNENEMKPADLVSLTGIQKSTISMYLSGQRDARADKLLTIAKKFNVNPSWLAGFNVDRNITLTNTNDTEKEFISKYNKLDECEKDIVVNLMNSLIERKIT